MRKPFAEPEVKSCPQVEDPSGQSFAAVHVPGAAAPTLQIENLWMAITRWVLKSGGPFASFLHSYISNKPFVEKSTANCLWPVPAPYPKWLGKIPGGQGKVSLDEGSRQRAVNLSVLALSWLHMGCPKVCPPQLWSGKALSSKQQVVVDYLEGHYRDIQIGAVGPTEMGRSAARVEGLYDFLVSLHDEVEKLLPHSYLERAVRTSGPGVSKLKPGHRDLEAGEVVGHLPINVPSLAKQVEPSRLSLPQGRPEFDASGLLLEPHRTVFEDPISVARPPDPTVDRPPRVRVHASKQQALGLLHNLDRGGRLRLAPKEKIRSSHLCGCFSLVKDSEKDRMILDARPPNELETPLQSWCKTLGSLQSLSQLELEEGFNMYFSGTDLRDYYYSFRVSKLRSFRNCFNLPLTVDQAREFDCFTEDLHSRQIIFPCLNTLAMGDNQAVELGQKAHVRLGVLARAFSPFELLSIHGRPPRGAIAAGVVIDDFIIGEKLPVDHCSGGASEGTKRLDRICEEYLQRGLLPHPKKTFRSQSSAEFWGGLCNGISGHIRPNPKRLIPLTELTSKTARLGFATVGLLEILSGAWISVLQSRRRMLCLLQNIYQAQRGRDRGAIVKMSPALISELWLLCILGPLACSDLRAESIPEMFWTDASTWGTASVRCQVPTSLTKEFQRHTLARGAWSRLLSPCQSWLRSHDDLDLHDELPEGVPLVSHPLWTELSRCLPFQLYHRTPCRRKQHINCLELKAILEVETKLAKRRHRFRYLLASDSQVALAAIVKGRSGSPTLNKMLLGSLPTVLGSGIVGNYSYVPSLVNPADDPTRGSVVREVSAELPPWWDSALLGDFRAFDIWLEGLGFDPLRVAKLPFEEGSAIDVDRIKHEFIPDLRSVQKPERLKKFDAKESSVVDVGKSISTSSVDKSFPVSLFEVSEEKNQKREHQKPESKQQKKKSPKERKDRGQNSKAVVSPGGVAPPLVRKSSNDADDGQQTIGCKDDFASLARPCKRGAVSLAEHELSPELSGELSAELASFPGAQFVLPGGKRSKEKFVPRRKGFLDLFSGESGVAKELSRKYNVWTLTFDYTHNADQDLLDEKLQRRLLDLLRKGAFLGFGAAPECCSFSRAVVPPWRSRDFPGGLPHLSGRALDKVHRGNRMAAFVLSLILVAVELSLPYWVENPDSSFMWMLDSWMAAGIGQFQRCFRFDQCRYGTAWRKRTRIATSTALAGLRELCLGGHSHIQLRGRSHFHRMNWPRVAQTYPRRLCARVAGAMGKAAGLTRCVRESLDVAGCSRCGSLRVGEASHPGPRKWAHTGKPRDPTVLLDTHLVDRSTQLLQEKVWQNFQAWLEKMFSPETISQVFISAPLGAQVLKRYGIHLYSSGKALYELRHLLVLVQTNYPLMRASLHPAWNVLTKWEEIQPVKHRAPLPEVLYKAMVCTALFWHWDRFAACLVLGMEGIARVGEILAAMRMDLVLPRDLFDAKSRYAFLKIQKPKTKRRGRGRVQHLRVEDSGAIALLDRTFGHLNDCLKLFPLSGSAFRSRWDKILDFLQVPRHLRPLPSSIRGGGAVMAYRKGDNIQNILWRMRLVNQATLESYLQELAADSILVRLPETSKARIRFLASFFTRAMSLG